MKYILAAIPAELVGHKLDKLRGTDFRTTFPDMAYLLDEPE